MGVVTRGNSRQRCASTAWAMAPAIALALSTLRIFQTTLEVGDEQGAAAHQRIQQRVEQLIQEMTQLLFAASQRWQFWAFAGGLVLLFWLCWRLWKRSRDPGSSSKQGSSRSLEEAEEEEAEEGEEPLHMDRFLNEYRSWALPSRRRRCMVVEGLVNELLRVCQMLSGNGFMPQLQPAVRVGSFREGRNARGGHLVYRLLVPLKPPRGHSFHLELGTEGKMLVRNSRLRVQLECTCTREQRLGDMLCFLHHPEDELMSTQEASLLQTLCTGSYLDVQKTAFWLQELITAACAAVPQAAKRRQVTVLPSTRFCKLKLTNAFRRSFFIELILAVQQGNSHTFVSME
ncbi:inositol 1,4,5-trisphosphate receptor-interacting protein-like 1 [Pelecanus crispus]|uniref:inositol 1,4,5-trisphosphate receptor-interacting protein-like 1 n=1 Tax=Pelecanus crispus TaxID=36300 RepID=UPI003F5D2B56